MGGLTDSGSFPGFFYSSSCILRKEGCRMQPEDSQRKGMIFFVDTRIPSNCQYRILSARGRRLDGHGSIYLAISQDAGQ